MKHTLFSLLLIFLGISQSQAQIPGYQGKRFFIELGATLFPNISFAPTAQNKGPNSFPFNYHTGHFTMTDRYSLALNYVVGRKHTFKAAYNYSVSGLNTFAQTESITSNGSDLHNLFYQLHIHDANLAMIFSGRKNANLAPLGFYWDLGLRFLFIRGDLRDQRVEYYNNAYPDHIPRAEDLNPLDINTFTFMLGLTAQWGYRAIFADRIILNVGLQTTLFPQHPFAVSGVSFYLPTPLASIGNGAGQPTNSSEYQNNVIKSVGFRYMLGIHVSVGALIF